MRRAGHVHDQPSSSPVTASTASPAMLWSMSAMHRPSTTAAELIGSDRNRSVTPLAASALTAVIVDSNPKSIAMVKIPGIRKA